ncbi:MAG: hypothetical protein K2M67_01505 [Muribaculaceae bacterium]|nr:hypothetical protein [Muribaculaceae bacterium]
MKRPAFSSLLLTLLIFPGLSSYGETIHWNPRRGYGAFIAHEHTPGTSLIIGDENPRRYAAIGLPSKEFELSFRAANLNNLPTRSYSYHDSDGRKHSVTSPAWSVESRGVRGDGIRIRFKSGESGITADAGGDGVTTRRLLHITVSPCAYPDSVIASSYVADNIDVNSGMNSFRLVRESDNWTLYGGNRRMSRLLSFSAPMSESREIGFSSDPGGGLEVAYITYHTPDINPRNTEMSATELADAIKKASRSEDVMEGEWVVYDRSLEEDRLRMGGDYRLLMLASEGGYDLIYLEGARTNTTHWSQGMLKARMMPTRIPGVWNVIWYDASGEALSRDVRAQYDAATSLLTINFPYSTSVVRLFPVRD